MNIENSSLGGKHGSIRVATNERQTSTHGTLNQILLTDSTFFSTDKKRQFDDHDDLK